MANHPQPHRSRRTNFFGILLAIGTSIGTSGAATIFLEDTLDLETSSFIDGRDPVARATVSSTGGGTPFIVDFSGLGETVISYTWKAPAGQRFVVTPPTGSSSFSIDLAFFGGVGSFGTGSYEDNSPLVGFSGASGTFEVVDNNKFTYVRLTDPGSGLFLIDFSLRLSAPLDQSFSFESATITTTVPAAFATDFSLSTTSRLVGEVSGFTSSQGQWIALEAVPEPSSGILLISGMVGLLAIRRRC